MDVYVELTEFSHRVQRLMYVEEKLVSIGELYEPVPIRSSPDYRRVRNQQRQHAERYYRYMEMRRQISAELSTKAGSIGENLRAATVSD